MKQKKHNTCTEVRKEVTNLAIIDAAKSCWVEQK